MAGVEGFGAVLRFGSTPVVVVNVNDISGPGIKRDTIDMTTHDTSDGYRVFGKGLADGGEVTLSINWDPTEATHQFVTGGLPYLIDTGDSESFELEFNATTGTYKSSFTAFVTQFEPTAPVEDKQTADVTLKISGKPTWAAVP